MDRLTAAGYRPDQPRDPGGESGGQWVATQVWESPGKEIEETIRPEVLQAFSRHSSNSVYRMSYGGKDWNVKKESNYPHNMRENIVGGRDTQRELAAQEVWQIMAALDPAGVGALGYPEFHRWLVATDPEFTVGTHWGSKPVAVGAAEWIDAPKVSSLGSTPTGMHDPPNWPGTDVPQLGWMHPSIPDRQLRALVLFDHVIGNQDRHGANARFDGVRLYPIDHGLTFPSAPDAHTTYWSGPGMWIKRRGTTGSKLTELERNVLVEMDKNWDDVVRRVSPHLTKKEIQSMRTRVQYMIREDEFLTHNTIESNLANPARNQLRRQASR